MTTTTEGSKATTIAVTVTFEAAVLAVEGCSIGTTHVPMRRSTGDKWTGNASVAPSSQRQAFVLSFRAPAHTDYEVTVKAGDKKVLEESGTSDRGRFSIEETVTISATAEV